MKDFIGFVVFSAIVVGLMFLVLNSKNVKEAEYHHCVITSVEKNNPICEEIIK